LGDQQLIELALRNRSDQRRAFDQLIACGREDAPFGLGCVLNLMAGGQVSTLASVRTIAAGLVALVR